MKSILGAWPVLIWMGMAGGAAAELYKCSGRWSNEPCPGAPAETVRAILERDPAFRPSPTPAPAASPAPTAAPEERKLQKTRKAPEVSWETKDLEPGREYTVVEVEGKFTGQGKVRLEMAARWMGLGGRERRQTVWLRTYELPPEGGEVQFKEKLKVPTGSVLDLRAVNTGAFGGFHDLSGCCAEGQGAVCEREGVVRCGDGQPSSKCRCGR